MKYVALLAFALVGCSRGGADASAVASPVVLPEPGPRAPNVADVPLPASWKQRPATAALEALLEGYGIHVESAVIDRECPLSAEGASIDDIEDAAKAHGLVAEQILIPVAYVPLPEAGAFPSIYVGVMPDGAKEFGVAWKRNGDRVQLFRPSSGRAEVTVAQFTESLFVHRMPMPRKVWDEWATGAQYRALMRARMRLLGLSPLRTAAMFTLASPGATKIAALDAAVRAVPERTPEPDVALQRLFDCASAQRCENGVSVPDEAWGVRPMPNAGDGEPQVMVRGAVLVVIRGRSSSPRQP